MTKENPLQVFLLTLFTLGFYGIYWFARTRGDMVRKGASVPTTWLIIIPLVNIYYFWKWSVGAEYVTKSKISAMLAFSLLWLLPFVGAVILQIIFREASTRLLSSLLWLLPFVSMAILQNHFNKVGAK